MGATHMDAVRDKVGVYYKKKRSVYVGNCKGCGKGYHSHYFEAHHILPGTCFTGLDSFVKECCGVSDFDINADYSMAGMPALKSFLLYFRGQATQAERGNEDAPQLSRWEKIRIHKYRDEEAIEFPGDIPVHQPVSFGHAIYNGDVEAKLEEDIWDNLIEKSDEQDHPEPEDIKSQIEAVKDFFWNDLEARGSGEGGGGLKGVKDNFLERKGDAADGWWKPMSMADLVTPPTPPASFF